MMKNVCFKKALVVGIIALFLGLIVQPSMNAEIPDKIEIEPKDYLFQTLIDTSNQPEIKELLGRYENDLVKVDIYKSCYRKIFFRNPRLIFQLIYTKPSVSLEYLNFIYFHGNKITNILGEDKLLEIVESIKFTNPEFFDELNHTIMNDEELSHRISILKEMNEELNPDLTWEDYPIICTILKLILIPGWIIGFFFVNLVVIFDKNPILFLIVNIGSQLNNIYWVPLALLFLYVFGCSDY